MDGAPTCQYLGTGSLVAFGNIDPVASLASHRCRLVEQHEFALHRLLENVAGCAGGILMATLEREFGFLVIEERGLPLVAVVATGAIAAACAELVGVRILVALTASRGSAGEPNVE